MKKILRIFFTSWAGTVISMIGNIIMIKVFALMLNAQGVGLFSIIRQANLSFSVLASFNGSSAIIQGMNAKHEDEKSHYIITCVVFMLLFGSAISLLMVLTAQWLASWLFDDASQTLLVYGLAFAVWLSVSASIAKALLNGHMAIGYLAIVTASGGVGLAISAYPAAILMQQGYNSALILPLIVAAIFSVASAGLFLHQGQWLEDLFGQKKKMYPNDLRHFLKVSGAILISSFVAAMVLLIVRSAIVQYDGLVAAGIFAAAWALGVVYLNLMMGAFATYLLPVLSHSSSTNDQQALLMDHMLRISLAIMLPVLLFAILNKQILIHTFYSEEFIMAADLLHWLLLASYIQVTNRVFGTLLLAHADMTIYTITSCCFSMLFMMLTLFLLQNSYPLEWIGIVLFCLLITNMFFVVSFVIKRYSMSFALALLLRWCFGLSLLLACSALTWSYSIPFFASLPLIGIGTFLSLVMLTRDERKQGLAWFLKKVRFTT